MTIGVLVMAYGTPASLAEVEAYYTHIRRGRPPEPEQLEDLVRRYEAIGGLSPLAAHTAAQRAAIEATLAGNWPDRFVVGQGNKHAAPMIEEGAAALADAGVERIVGVVLAPHYSQGSVAQYLGRLREASPVPVDAVEHWYDLPAFVEHQAAALTTELTRLAAAGVDPARTVVRFTAHSLPLRVLEGDPYEEQLAAGAAAIAGGAGVPAARWSRGWQSAGRTPEPWAGPDILDEVAALSGRAEGIVVVPHGFVADHLEVLYDLDIDAARVAAEAGVAFGRTAVVNDDPAVMAALAGRVAAAAGVGT